MGGPRRVLVITGARGAGKTYAAGSLARRWRRSGLCVGGILSRAARRDGITTAYTYVEIGTGRRSRYARLRARPALDASAYVLREAGLERGRRWIRRAAARANLDVLIVDEIGPLEMGGTGLWEEVRRAAESFGGTLVLTTRPSLVRRLRRRLGTARVRARIRVLTPDAALAVRD